MCPHCSDEPTNQAIQGIMVVTKGMFMAADSMIPNQFSGKLITRRKECEPGPRLKCTDEAISPTFFMVIYSVYHDSVYSLTV